MKSPTRSGWSTSPVSATCGLLALVLVAACGSGRPGPSDAVPAGSGGNPVTPPGSGGASGGAGSSGAIDAGAATGGAGGADASLPSPDAPSPDASSPDAPSPDASLPSPDAPSPDASRPTPDASGPFVPPNSRLQARQLEVEGAPPLVLGIWDTVEKVHCRFTLDEKGEQRCLPYEATVVATVFVPTESFADPQCKSPFFWLQQDASLMTKGPLDRPWTRALPPQSCEPVRYQVLRPAPTARPLYGFQNGACKLLSKEEQSVPSSGAMPFVAESPDGWVKGTDVMELRLTDRLRLVETVTPDGARFAKGLRDEHWGMPCGLSSGTVKGATVCRPPTLSTSMGYYADETCKMPLFWLPACSSPPAFIEDGLSRYALSAPFVGAVYYGAKGCDFRETTTAAPTATRYFAKGALLGDDAVAPPVAETTAGTGRFQLHGLKSESGGFVAFPFDFDSYITHRYFDTTAQEDCQTVWDVNGKVRCIPSSAHVDYEGFFGDRDCTHHAVRCEGAACASQKFLLSRRELNGDARVYVAYAGATLLAKNDIFYKDTSGACTAAGQLHESLFEPKDEISLDVFPSLTEHFPLPSHGAVP